MGLVSPCVCEGILCYFLCYIWGRELALNEAVVKVGAIKFLSIKSMVL